MGEWSESRYAADDFLSAASAAGMPRSLPWLRSLITDGLLDQPHKHGLPGQRGGRAPGTWPDTQFQLFLAVLAQMRKGIRRTATLCNVPVGGWLYLGPDRVPVRQVRRALHTYGATYRTTSKRAARETARTVAEQFAGGSDMNRRDRDRLTELIVDAATTPTFDRDALINSARQIFDPEHTNRTVGLPVAPLSPEAWVRTIEAHLIALDRLDALPESAFEDARLAHLEHMNNYIELQPKLARNRDVAALHEPVTREHLLSNACQHTIAVLGFLQLAGQNNNTQHQS